MGRGKRAAVADNNKKETTALQLSDAEKAPAHERIDGANSRDPISCAGR